MGLGLCAALVFASCAKETPYSPGNPAGNMDVYFSEDNDATVVMGLSDTEFEVYLERSDAGSAVTIPLTCWCNTEGIATFPETVTFAAGEDLAIITVKVSEAMEPFVEYQFNISIPEEYTQPYKSDSGAPQCGAVFYKEDYKPWATGTLYDDFLWEDYLPDTVVERSDMLGYYRIDNWLYLGNNFIFGWDGDQTFKSVVASQPTGYNHPSYGMIYGTVVPAYSYYDEDDDAICIAIKWTVSAGSFGTYYDVFYIEEYAN